MLNTSIMVAFFIFFTATPAFAYIDPGTGSLVLQSIIGAIALASAFITSWREKIMALFRRKGAAEQMPVETKLDLNAAPKPAPIESDSVVNKGVEKDGKN